MLVYTTNSTIKQKLINMGIVLLKEKKADDKVYSFFRLDNPSIMNTFSFEENKEIVVCDNTLFL